MPDTRPELSQEYDPTYLQEMTKGIGAPPVSEGITGAELGSPKIRASEILRSPGRRRISILPIDRGEPTGVPETFTPAPGVHRPESTEAAKDTKEREVPAGAGSGNKPPTTPPKTSRGPEFDDGDDGKDLPEKSDRLDTPSFDTSDSRRTPEVGLPVLRGDVPRLSLGGDKERALERTPDEIAINEERRVQLATEAKDMARPYERALRDIVPDEPRKGLFGRARSGSVERQFEKTVKGQPVNYRVAADFTPYGEINNLTKAVVQISRPDIPTKKSPTLSLEFGRNGLDTATLDLPYDYYGYKTSALDRAASLPGGQAFSGLLEAFTKDMPSTQGFTLQLSVKEDQLTCQFRQEFDVSVPYGEISTLRTMYNHTSLIYNPATDTFDKYYSGWKKHDFQPLKNDFIDSRARNDSSSQGFHMSRETFFAQLHAMLGLLPTQE